MTSAVKRLWKTEKNLGTSKGIDMNKTHSVDNYLHKELLRFTTAGSVDDGKSTLIGRMLYDSKAIFQDQMEALERTSTLRGDDEVDLALLTDGLRAEREQGITIDVAYRYFSTPKRKFIIADTPGHVQYTRNMITGASTADLAIILIDARNGVLTQSKRHGFIASLLGIRHLLVAVNKMDLVGWSEDVYNKIVEDYTTFSEKLEIHDMTFIPISALKGDNVVDKSKHLPWYDGGTVMHYLESVTISSDRNLIDFRFPVQYVVRPHLDFRGFAGRIASGTIKVGEEIISLPSCTESRIKEIIFYEDKLEEVFEGQSVIITLEDEIDISRGDMIVRKHNVPTVSNTFEAILCWMDDTKPLNTSTFYEIQHTTKNVQGYVRNLRYKIDVNTLHRESADHLLLNEIGKVRIETTSPLFFDPYTKNRQSGSFILIDPAANLTVGAGMIVKNISEIDPDADSKIKSTNVMWEDRIVTREDREEKYGQKAQVFWFTGLSGSGKTTLARELEKKLFDEGKQVYLLDGDNIRHGINGDLGFTEKDRKENIRRIGHIAKLLYNAGFIVLCSFISPKREMREFVRGLFPEGSFSEVFVKCDIKRCISRDPKGLYKKALAGEILNFTGITAVYEEPEDAEIVIDTEKVSIQDGVGKLGSRLIGKQTGDGIPE